MAIHLIKTEWMMMFTFASGCTPCFFLFELSTEQNEIASNYLHYWLTFKRESEPNLHFRLHKSHRCRHMASCTNGRTATFIVYAWWGDPNKAKGHLNCPTFKSHPTIKCCLNRPLMSLSRFELSFSWHNHIEISCGPCCVKRCSTDQISQYTWE